MKKQSFLLVLFFLLCCNFSCIESSRKQALSPGKPTTLKQETSDSKTDSLKSPLTGQSESLSKHTIKTLPKGSQLVLKPTSPFFKTYATWRPKVSLDTKAWDKAFKFLNDNYKELQKDQVCLASDNKENRKKIRNLNCMVIADYTQDKMQKRLYVVELKNNKVHSLYTAHGKGSNLVQDESLMATKFSNKPGSLQTSLGFYLSAEPYNSYKDTFGPRPNNGIKLDGISCSNNNARKRYIVMHTAKYVPEEVSDKKSIGYSEGCITFTAAQKALMHKCMHGALVYTYGKSSKPSTN